jgi:hypothetical protein
LVRFELTSSGGNNVYVDDINLGGPTGIETVLNPVDWVISPNPNIGQFNLDFILDKQSSTKFSLLDIMGRTVYEIPEKVYSIGSHSEAFNFSQVEKGIYFLSVHTQHGNLTQKLIIE